MDRSIHQLTYNKKGKISNYKGNIKFTFFKFNIIENPQKLEIDEQE